VKSGTLIAVEIIDVGVTRPIGIIHRSGKHFSPAVDRFIEYLQASSARQGRCPDRPAA